MSVTLPLPPSGRDFLAYQRVVVDAASTRVVAGELSISQTRVRQIVRRVIDWLQQSLPQDTELSEAASLRVGRHIAADRLERYYGQANRLWEQTGQAKYLNAILKILNTQTKLPAMAGTIEAMAMDAIIGPLPDDSDISREQTCSRSAKPSSTGRLVPAKANDESPPPGACSPSAKSQPVANKKSAAHAAVNPSSSTPSHDVPDAKTTARRAFLAPAQPPEGEALSEPSTAVAQIKITAESLGVSPTQHTSRRDRRRLRRLMASK